MNTTFRRIACLAALMVASLALPARAFETAATHAWVYDITTNTVLLDKNGEDSVPPASMSKLMTVEMLFEALQDGRVQCIPALAFRPRRSVTPPSAAQPCICNRVTGQPSTN